MSTATLPTTDRRTAAFTRRASRAATHARRARLQAARERADRADVALALTFRRWPLRAV